MNSKARAYTLPTLVLSLGLSCAALGSCTHGGQTSNKTDDYAKQLVGKWQYSEINSGTTCVVTFHADKRLDQYFRNAEGRDKLRPGSWELLGGDTICLSDQTGPTKLTIETLNDSVLTLHTLDSFPVIFYRLRGDSLATK